MKEQMILDCVKEVEIGKIYNGEVVKVEDYGCFVKLWDNCEGFVHVSQLAHERVEKPSDMVSVGDEIIVKAVGFDKRGKLTLSRKEAIPAPKKKEEKKETNKEEKEVA